MCIDVGGSHVPEDERERKCGSNPQLLSGL